MASEGHLSGYPTNRELSDLLGNSRLA
jgi:hypothetical protein